MKNVKKNTGELSLWELWAHNPSHRSPSSPTLLVLVKMVSMQCAVPQIKLIMTFSFIVRLYIYCKKVVPLPEMTTGFEDQGIPCLGAMWLAYGVSTALPMIKC